jgi:hypothetical protein
VRPPVAPTMPGRLARPSQTREILGDHTRDHKATTDCFRNLSPDSMYSGVAVTGLNAHRRAEVRDSPDLSVQIGLTTWEYGRAFAGAVGNE